MSFYQNMSHNPSSPYAVVIPVFNHAGTVAEVIRQVLAQNLPVIVVDDGSTDDTLIEIRTFTDARVICHRQNQGKGAALLTGLHEAAKIASWAICLDADGQHDPDDIPKLIKAIPKNRRTILIGKRQGMEKAPWTSRFGRQFSNFWVWVSGAGSLCDTQSGFRVYPLPEVLKLEVKARRYQYELEVLARAAWQGIDIIEVPVNVDYEPSGLRISHFRPFVDFVRNTNTFSRLITHRLFNPRLWKIHK